ncbi:glycoside hydrolase [Puteibacter caeruleilacunae]|nr:glycoside hydrolase [Puteibacter caeruleilacunae]
MNMIKYNKLGYLVLILIFKIMTVGYCQNTVVKDMINQTGMINVEAGKENSFIFTDLGAWHGYGICKNNETSSSLSFRGPVFLVDGGLFYGPNDTTGLVRLSVCQNDRLMSFERISAEHTPGLLKQHFKSGKLHLSQRLVYVSSKQSLIETVVENKGSAPQSLELKWTVATYSNEKLTMHQEQQVLVMNTAKHGAYGLGFVDGKQYLCGISNNECEVRIDKVILKPGEKRTVSFVETYVPDEEKDSLRFKKLVDFSNVDVRHVFEDNKHRWENYFDRIVGAQTSWVKTKHSQMVATKALQTLVTNWRSSAKDLQGDGIYPSVGHFNGYWAWDSWKHAAAIAKIMPELAKKQIQSMFLFQNENGMIGDVTRYYGQNDNWRDSKPPLAGWAVWFVYNATGDIEFLKELYPKLIKYHRWWYKERDANKNGLCEYGSTDGSHQAAAWESGMDNAVRFDNTKVVQQSYGGTYDQESVDLNCFLWKEKVILEKIALVLGDKNIAKAFKLEAKKLRGQIIKRFWDDTDGYFYDWSLRENRRIKIAGSEGWSPLFVGLATDKQAKKVVSTLIDPDMFNSYVPLGTLAINSSMYEEDGYWRGPVWLDQVYFGIRGLRNYGYQYEADKLQEKVFNHLEGIGSPGIPIRENYDPLSGKGLRAIHFSWSSAHLLMLLMEAK